MLNRIRSCCTYTYIVSCLLVSFSLTSAVPLNADTTNLEQAFLIRMENAANIIPILAESKNLNELVKYFFSLKADVESHYGIQVDFDEYFNNLYSYMQTQGINISKKSLDVIKIKFKMLEKKLSVNSMKAEVGIQNNNHFSSFDGFDVKVGNGPNNSCDYDNLPSDLICGVTMGLCGLLLMFIPIPPI